MLAEPPVRETAASPPPLQGRLLRLAQYLRWRDYLPALRRYNDAGRDRVLLDRYGDLLEGRILDVCCGSTYAPLRRALGARYEGLDIPDSYKFEGDAGAEVRPQHFCNLEQERLPFDAGSFDTVMCISALEHVDNIHEAYDELFRVARRRVIVMLPNNWVGFIGSLLAGHNYTHRAGYGLAPRPKRPGERHKHFFNLEEAAHFLVGRAPDSWRVRRLDCSFERGTDTWLAWRPYALAGTVSREQFVRRFGRPGGGAAYLTARMLYYPVRALEWLIGITLWGIRGRVVYHNLMCREIWVVLDRSGAGAAPE